MVKASISKVHGKGNDFLLVFNYNGRAVAVKRMGNRDSRLLVREIHTAFERICKGLPDSLDVEVLGNGEAMASVMGHPFKPVNMLTTGRFPNEADLYNFFAELRQWYEEGNLPEFTIMRQQEQQDE